MRNGWYVVIDYEVEPPGYLAKMHALQQLSSGIAESEVIACYESSYGSTSGVAAWTGGQRIWSVIHDSAQAEGPNHILGEGEPPVEFAALLAKAWDDNSRSDGIDYVFDVPITFAGNLTGFSENRKLPRGSKITVLA